MCFGSGLLITWKSNLSIINSSVMTMLIKTHDWRPNFWHSLWEDKLVWLEHSQVAQLTDRRDTEMFLSKLLHPKRWATSNVTNWACEVAPTREHTSSRMYSARPPASRWNDYNYRWTSRGQTHRDDNQQGGDPTIEAGERLPIELNPAVRTELSNDSFELASISGNIP